MSSTAIEVDTDLIAALSSSLLRERISALRRILSLLAQGKDLVHCFPAVVKNVSSTSIQARRCVYIYLIRYAHKEPDLALLSINAVQRALTHKNPILRALALRVIASIRVPAIAPIVLLAIKKFVTDSSPIVRAAAAHAIPKCHSRDPSNLATFTDLLVPLLADLNHSVVAPAIASLVAIAPHRWDLCHSHYRHWCRLLIDMDDWNRLIVLNFLFLYARTHFQSPIHSPLDIDLDLLLRSSLSLVESRNSAVVMAVVKIYRYLAPPQDLYKVAPSLVRLLREPFEIQYIALFNISAIATSRPDIFHPYLSHFFIWPLDPVFCKELKLDILPLLITEQNADMILAELQYYSRSLSTELSGLAVRATGRCAFSVPSIAESCLLKLLKNISLDTSSVSVSESIQVIRQIIQMNPEGHRALVRKLGRALPRIKPSEARMNIIWMMGEYVSLIPDIAPDLLRFCAKVFTQETTSVKLQILLFASKFYCLCNRSGQEEAENGQKDPVALLFEYIFQLSRFDLSHDLRDRARFYKALVSSPSLLAKEVLFVNKPLPLFVVNLEHYTVGSASLCLKREAVGYVRVPEWATDSTPSSLREEVLPPSQQTQVDVAPDLARDIGTKSSRAITGLQSLDDFYATTSEEDIEEESEEEEEEEEEEDDSSDENEERAPILPHD